MRAEQQLEQPVRRLERALRPTSAVDIASSKFFFSQTQHASWAKVCSYLQAVGPRCFILWRLYRQEGTYAGSSSNFFRGLARFAV